MVKLDPNDVARIAARKRKRDTGWSPPVQRVPDINDFSPQSYPGRVPLDHAAVFLPFSEIRARRQPYNLGDSDGCGIYFLFRRWVLLYVGLSVNVSARLRAHYMKRLCARYTNYQGTIIWFDKVTVLPVPECWLDDVESHYIATLRPPYNIKGIPPR